MASNIQLSAIPKAKEFSDVQEKKKVDKDLAVDLFKTRWDARVAKAADQFVEAMTGVYCRHITNLLSSSLYSKRVEVRIPRLGIYQGLPGDVILYGHRLDRTWYNRAPLGLAVTPFERLQAAFYAQGWYLVEESDPSRSFAFVFALYTELPKRSKVLWHNHNFFDEKKIANLGLLIVAVEEAATEDSGDVEEPDESMEEEALKRRSRGRKVEETKDEN